MAALLLAAIALVAVANAARRTPPSAGGSKTSSAQPRGVARRLLPIWDGDSFSVRKRNTDLPPYLFSSASGPREGWLQQHSNTNPNVDGVTVVDDPAALTSSAPPGGVRKVIKITTDERRAFAGKYVRTEIQVRGSSSSETIAG